MSTKAIQTFATVIVAHAVALGAVLATLQAQADQAVRPVFKPAPAVVKAPRIEVRPSRMATANLEQPTLALLRLPASRV